MMKTARNILLGGLVVTLAALSSVEVCACGPTLPVYKAVTEIVANGLGWHIHFKRKPI